MVVSLYRALLVPSLAAAVFLLSCDSQKTNEPPSPGKTEPGAGDPEKAPPAAAWYRAAIVLADDLEVPFFLHLLADGKAVLVNGAQEIPISYKWSGAPGARRLSLSFNEVQESRVAADEGTKGALSGKWTTTAFGLRDHTFEFRARPIPALDWSQLFGVAPAEAVKLEGLWKIEFKESGLAKMQIEPLAPGAFSASIHTQTSEYGHLVGQASRDQVQIGFFDGYHAFVLRGTLDADGKTLKGTSHLWTIQEDPFTATLLDKKEFEPFDQLKLMKMSPQATRKMPLLQPLCGKPAIIEVGGTWCTICNDAAPVFRQLIDQYKSQDLTMVMLALEFEDAAAAEERAAKYKKEHDLPWEVRGVADLEALGKLLPGIPEVNGIPVTLFVRRDGTLEAIHSGFSSVAVKDVYARQKATFERLAKAIVESPPARSCGKP